MIEPDLSMVEFDLVDVPDGSNLPQDIDNYELDFNSFLKATSTETSAEDFSYSTNSIKMAGRSLRKKEGDLKKAKQDIQRFRAAHQRPLDTVAYLVGRACREEQVHIKVVKRLKRLDTIIGKLQRESLDGKQSNGICVTNMDDIGGCRAIFPDMATLERVQKHLLEMVQQIPL